MKAYGRWVSMVSLTAALLLSGGWGPPSKATVSVVVTKADGSPLPGLTVRFYKTLSFEGGGGDNSGVGPAGKAALQKAGAKIAEKTTDSNGKFEVELPVGKVIWKYGSTEEGGVKMGSLEVKAGSNPPLQITTSK